jgi:hypothetical protein
VFRDLVIARVVEPTSLLDTGRVRLVEQGRLPGLGEQSINHLLRVKVSIDVQRQLPRIVQQLTGAGHQYPQLSLGMRRAERRHDPLPARTGVLHDLYRRGPRTGPHTPHKCHSTTLRSAPLVREIPAFRTENT